MHSKYLKIMLPAAVLLVSACRPSSQDNFLFENAAEQVQIKVTEQKRQITFKGAAGKKITRVKLLATSRDQSGTFTPAANKKYVSLATSEEKTLYDVELTLDTTTNCKNSASNGIPLHNASSFNISCVNETALTAQLKGICKDLATDAATAEYDEAKDTCHCLKRSTDKLVKYADYFGKASTFKVECTNTATREQLKTICTEIKDKQCPTCTVGALSCECTKKFVLVFDDYLEKVDSFRSKCEEPKFLKPVDATLTAAQQLDKFESDCKKVGTLPASNSASRSCACTNGHDVSFESWKKDQDAISKSCALSLEPEADADKSAKFEKSCTANNGSFDQNADSAEDPVCTCKNTNTTDNEILFKDYLTKGAAAIKALCGLKAVP